MHQKPSGCRALPDPLGELERSRSLSAPQDPLAILGGRSPPVRDGKGWKVGRGGKGRGRGGRVGWAPLCEILYATDNDIFTAQTEHAFTAAQIHFELHFCVRVHK